MQICPICSSQMILENDVPKCIFCFGKKQVTKSKNPSKVLKDPGEAALTKVSKGTMEASTAPAPAPRPVMRASGSAEDALAIMRALPMPKDVREFRKIQKIIKLMEELTGESNGAD